MTEPPEARGASVLIVDDDCDIRDTLAEFLQDEGFEVARAQHGRDALEHLRTHRAPSVILLDLSMPVMDGVAFLAEQAKDPELCKIPVVIFTAGQQQGAVPASLPVLKKPPDLEKLVALLQAYRG